MADAVPRPYSRYVALGDSQTEGLLDGDDTAGYRGWADRLAEELTRHNPDLSYANLAVRGLRARQVRDGQLAAALELRPDVATVVAGMNDIIRPKYDGDQVVSDLEDMFAALTGAGTKVATLTFPDIGKIMPAARVIAPRVLHFNATLRTLANRYNLALLDAFPHAVCTDRRIWSADRIHANSTGHARIAGGMARALGLPGSDDSWAAPLPPPVAAPRWSSAFDEVRWGVTFLSPWLLRRIRRVSSADGRTAKRPDLAPLSENSGAS
jgi:lysophospholipase L1-like esterase